MTKQPTNAKTGNEYTNGNIVKLNEAGFASNEWATYRQWKDLGAQVQKGEKGVRLTKMVTVTDKAGEDKIVPRGFTVFNVEQTQTEEQQSERAEWIAGHLAKLEEWVMQAKTAKLFASRQAYMNKWISENA